MSAIRINGIRVGHQVYHLRQHPARLGAASDPPLYRTLTGAKMNMPCLGLEGFWSKTRFSCCIEGPLPPELGHPLRPAAMVSVFPHGCEPATLGCVLSLFGEKKIPFFYMASSNAMISFVMADAHLEKALAVLESSFDLPPTHTPYAPGFHEETAAFVQRRYQETRAYYHEQRVKTYGFCLETGLTLTALEASPQVLGPAGRIIAGIDKRFYFSLVLWDGQDYRMFCLTPGPLADAGTFSARDHGRTVDLVTFHGPHFGDRFGIFNQAAACLDLAHIPMILAGCTGASISLVVDRDQGRAAILALERGFETP
jgi:hypothetical protein